MQKLFSIKYTWFITAVLITLISMFVPLPSFLSGQVIGLVLGIVFALWFGNPVKHITGKVSKKLLQGSVILLGFGMQIGVILQVGLASVGITFSSILLTMILGLLLGRFFQIERNLSILLTSGTAICGGSAIAAMAPSINANHTQTAVAMAIVFLLNAIGLILFPFLGNILGLNETEFGLWAAIAIHDTSSVVGAGAAYGTIAASIAITVKLTRALWIFPLSMGVAKLNKSESKPPFQWFLIGFLLAGVITSLFPSQKELWQGLSFLGKGLMSGTLFLVGSCLTMEEIRKLGVRSLSMAVILWLIISILSLIAIKMEIWTISPAIVEKMMSM